VTITQTPRFHQTQYSSGSDPLRRAQYNADGAAVEAQAAWDDGDTYPVLPSVGDIWSGRYVSYAPGAGTYRSLHRATGDHGTWEQAIGNTIPAPLNFRPQAAGDQAVGTAAVLFGHPDLASPAGQVTYDGQAVLSRIRAFDPNTASRGSVYIGDETPDLTNLGRFYLETRQSGDRGIVLQPHASAAGNMFASREPGGQDVVTIDASGYLRARSLAGFGGGAVNAGAAVVIAPTSASADGVDIGLLLHGQSGAAAKTILSVRRDLADSAPVLAVNRDSMTVGRLPWGSSSAGGSLALAGRQVTVRAAGYDANTVLAKIVRADSADPSDTGLDETVLSVSRASSLLRAPLTLSQALGTGANNLTVQRYSDFSARFLEFQRITGGTEVVAALEADGRLAVGARWRGAGVMRDARQPVNHLSVYTGGGAYSPGQTFTYVWPVMQLRSTTACDLRILGRLEAEVASGLFSDREDGQQWFYNFDISINGAGFTFITSVLMGGPSHRSGTRPIEVQDGLCWAKDVPAGATVQLRTRVFIGGATPVVTLRRQFLDIQESVVQDYTAS
jgi:hypothetical protein